MGQEGHSRELRATQVKQPFHGWVYEERIDGWRMLGYKAGRNVRLETQRHGPFEWEVLTHPVILHGGKNLRAMIRRPGLAETERDILWPAHSPGATRGSGDGR